MPNTSIFDDYKEKLVSLKSILISTKGKILQDSDQYFSDNANFFTKSFLVNACAYLESFIKEIAIHYIDDYTRKLELLKIPHNLVIWNSNLKKSLKDSELQFSNYAVKIKKKDLDDYISGNPYRTQSLFKYIGRDLTNNETFINMKDQINMIVVKRNKILHHNDDASDLSLDDISVYIDDLIRYMICLDNELMKNR